MNRFHFVFLGSVLFLLAAVSAFFLPSLAVSREQGGDENAAERGRPGHWRGGAEAPWISIILGHRSELNLSEEQVRGLEKLRADFQQQAVPRHEAMREAEKEITRLLKEEALDRVQVKTKIEEAERLRAESRYLRIEALAQGRSLLTAEQREQLKNLRASMQHRFHRPKEQKS